MGSVFKSDDQRGRLLAADLHSKNRSKKKNYDLFGGAYWVIRLALAFLFAIIGFITILAAMNTKLNVGLIIIISVLTLFMVMGNQFEKSARIIL